MEIMKNITKLKIQHQGIKLLGAGGGGFYLAIVKKRIKDFSKKNEKNLKFIIFKFDI